MAASSPVRPSVAPRPRPTRRLSALERARIAWGGAAVYSVGAVPTTSKPARGGKPRAARARGAGGEFALVGRVGGPLCS